MEYCIYVSFGFLGLSNFPSSTTTTKVTKCFSTHLRLNHLIAFVKTFENYTQSNAINEKQTLMLKTSTFVNPLVFARFRLHLHCGFSVKPFSVSFESTCEERDLHNKHNEILRLL